MSQTLTNSVVTSNVRQFVKFGVVGLSNNLVDYVTWRLIMGCLAWSWLPAQLAAFMVSITNGFVWNSLWTFRGSGTASRKAQYVRFFIVNLVSLGVGLLLMKSTLVLLNGNVSHSGPETLTHLNVAKAVAIICGAIWNYTLNKKWTFK